MLRIQTKIGGNRVYTLFFMGKWVTLITINGKSSSTDALNLYDAGVNHLNAAHKAKEDHERRGRTDTFLLSGRGHRGIDTHPISDGDDGTDRAGLDRSVGSERAKDVSPDEFGEEDQDTFAF